MKKRQVTDNIHGTIYLSQLESDLISTPYFYRLNDIYQSSTVYMTFPSNRTKRYEHSLGTMELASSMLFSSMNNADFETKEVLFKCLNDRFQNLCEAIMECDSKHSVYFNGCSIDIDQLFDRIKSSNETELKVGEYLEKAIADGIFKDFALDNFQHYSIQKSGKEMSLINDFLYRCLLQSIRIVALFHDVGHPPYSHILETVLKNLYNLAQKDIGKKWNEKRKKDLISCLKPYLSNDESESYQCNRLIVKGASKSNEPHERIGLSLLQSALDDVIIENITKIVKGTEDDNYKFALILYYITIVEFATAIIVDYDGFFASFHKFVDGIIDADRLDYIVRDMSNSGVDWGKIPYKRIVNSSKLILIDGSNLSEEISTPIFALAFPRKITDDIEDLLLVRYKIFARINFHHRCMKTSVALQSAVQDLAINYLLNDEEDINADISTLWYALGIKIGDRRVRIIKWNDSWLISALHTALINLKTRNLCQQYHLLQENLEEILLNKKRYCSLLKRGDENRDFVKRIFSHADITEMKLKELLIKEQKKLFSNNDALTDENVLCSPRSDASDSIMRITKLMEIKQQGNLELFQWIFPVQVENEDDGLETIINESLEKMKSERLVSDYKVIFNKARGKMGLAKHKNPWDEIYLYNNGDVDLYDEQELLAPQIKAIERTVSWLYVYFIPSMENMDIKTIENQLKETLAQDVACRVKLRYEELFPSQAHLSDISK